MLESGKVVMVGHNNLSRDEESERCPKELRMSEGTTFQAEKSQFKGPDT